jgi:hypothetical protein
MISLTLEQVLEGTSAFLKHERRDAMYKTATFLVAHFWRQPAQMADGLGVLLLTWNQAFYRYGAFDFDVLEACIAETIDQLEGFRSRDISTYDYSDNAAISGLFDRFNAALSIRKNGEEGPRSPVATAKALHLLAPAFFALWDNEIARAYGVSYQSEPDDKYIRFMREMKRIVRAIDLTALASETGKTPLKLIDECNYARFTKHWI